MNFGSQAQNPFLTTLDNVKKVALNTDGLGQSVLLKGLRQRRPRLRPSGLRRHQHPRRRRRGHEHPDGEGHQVRRPLRHVHVNASEMYPEAKAFSEDMVRRNSSGGLSYGWNWLDQGIGIDGIYDLASGMRKSRFADLKSKVGDNMDFIYLDVWGNNTSGAEDSWETRKMSQMINQNGWRMTTEWGAGNEYDATFQHWAADLTYGGSAMKGENSQGHALPAQPPEGQLGRRLPVVRPGRERPAARRLQHEGLRRLAGTQRLRRVHQEPVHARRVHQVHPALQGRPLGQQPARRHLREGCLRQQRQRADHAEGRPRQRRRPVPWLQRHQQHRVPQPHHHAQRHHRGVRRGLPGQQQHRQGH